MNRKLLLLIPISCLLGMALVSGTTSPQYSFPNKGSIIQVKRVHNLDTGINYTTIQEAINANETSNGHTIFVEEGTYCEHLFVNKSLSLVGENRHTTIVDGNGTGVVISLTRSDVIMTGFTIRNGTIGVKLHSPGVDQCQNITVSHNSITGMENGGCGILVFASHGNRIMQNMISNCWVGISLGSSYSNIITQNIISNNGRKGIASGLIIVIPSPSWLNSGSDNANKISENLIVDNKCGINVTNRSDEEIWHNNFINNTVQAYILHQYGFNATNIWDNNYPSGGNFWSNYEEKYPSAAEIDNSGIWDTPYDIDEKNIDKYPLIHPYGSIRNLDTNLTYLTIQSAIDAPETLDGHTIFVEEGIYYENVVMNKPLTLIGENSNTTIIDGNGQYACIVHIVADDVVMSGFTMRNNRDYPGIYLENSSYCVIRYNIFIDIPRYAIYTTGAEHCRIEANDFSSSHGNWGRGIQLRHSDNNTIADNQIMTHNDQYCIWLHNSSNCRIYGNWLAEGVDGLMIEHSYGCSVKKNLIENCERAIDIGWAVRGEFVGNLIRSNYHGVTGEGDEWIFYHNNFINNTHQAYVSVGEGDWNNTLEGNYWDDYTGTDSNHDGIGDIPYSIERSPNADNYPLMGRFSSFNTFSGDVYAICNSTISGFQSYYDSENQTNVIKFNVNGTEGMGFCRICIPHTILNETYTVLVDGHEPDYVNYTLYDNETHHWIYFTYQHSIHGVTIIPELPSFIILPLFMIATLLTVIFYTKRRSL